MGPPTNLIKLYILQATVYEAFVQSAEHKLFTEKEGRAVSGTFYITLELSKWKSESVNFADI